MPEPAVVYKSWDTTQLLVEKRGKGLSDVPIVGYYLSIKDESSTDSVKGALSKPLSATCDP